MKIIAIEIYVFVGMGVDETAMCNLCKFRMPFVMSSKDVDFLGFHPQLNRAVVMSRCVQHTESS